MANHDKYSTINQVASVVSLPGYEILDVLGKGGMAIVYLAVQKSIDRKVALKILAPDHNDDSFTERFLREAQIVSSLTHPHIITIYDAGVHQGCHFMAMEYVPGKNLRDARDLIDRKHKVQIIKQIAQALNYAGQKGYVHRDVKPENILLHTDGRAILTDFGIARNQDARRGLTMTGKVIGTPYYMSPEQTKGMKVDHRSDIYSLGIVLFQALTGYLPYDGPSLVAIGIKHLSDPIPTLPAGLEIFQPMINVCLSKEPEHRYQSAGDFYTALNQISDSELDFLNAKSKVNTNASTGSLAKTIATNSIQSSGPISLQLQEDDIRSKTASYATPYDVTTSDDFKRLNRRKKLLWLLLIVSLSAFAYTKKIEIHNIYQTRIKPEINYYLEKWGSNTSLQDSARQEQHTKSDHEAAQNIKNANPVDAKFEHVFISSLNQHPDNVEQLTISITNTLENDPNDAEAKIKLPLISNWYRLKVQKAMEKTDYTKARQLISEAKNSLPETYITQGLLLTGNQLLRHENINKHMQNAKKYTQQKNLITPANENAVSELRAVLLIDPGFAPAKERLHDIARHYLKIATRQQNSGKIHEALATAELGLTIEPEHVLLRQRQSSIKGDVQQQEALMSLLIQAESRFQAGKILSPRAESAVNLYKKVLRQDNENKVAQAGLLKAEDYAIQQIQAAIWKKKFAFADRVLSVALLEFPNSPRLDQLSKKYTATKVSSAPRITHLLVSDQVFGSLLTEQSTISLSPTLHVGFTYTNFSQETTVLELSIESITENRILVTKKIIVSEATGEHIFSVKHPVATFIAGQYRLKIKSKDKALTTRIFNIQSKPTLTNTPN